MMLSTVTRTWRGLMTASAALALTGALVAASAAQESSLRAERTVDYKVSKGFDLGAKVGPVRIQTVEFSNLGRHGGRSGIGARMRPGGSDSEVSTMLRAHFLAENPSSDEWEVTFTIEYLDKAGKVIERVTKKSSWEGEAKPYDFDHEILDYVVPMIAQVKIKMEGRLD
jgi:hypothetical protein